MSDSDSLALFNTIQNRNNLNKMLYKLKQFIKSGIDVDTYDNYKHTALMMAAEYGKENGAEMMSLLIDAKADVNKQDILGWTAIMYVAQFGGEHGADMIKLLVDAGADPNKQDKTGRTALMLVAQSGGEHSVEMMHLLIEAKADVNKQKRNGETALMYAAEYGNKHGAEMIKILLASKASVYKQSKDGRTALMYAAEYGCDHGMEMIKILIDAGAVVNKQDYYGYTALWMAATSSVRRDGKHNEDMVRLLVAHDSILKNPTRIRPYTRCIPTDIVAYINGAKNWTRLHRAADARDADAIIECLSKGMSPYDEVESPYPDMRTAISIAESIYYPTAKPVCELCLALLRPSLMKPVKPSGVVATRVIIVVFAVVVQNVRRWWR